MVSDPLDLSSELNKLSVDLKRLEAEYNTFFAGRLSRPPWETRRRVEAGLKRWAHRRIERSVDRFRFEMLQSRFASFAELWDRRQRTREEGRDEGREKGREEG